MINSQPTDNKFVVFLKNSKSKIFFYNSIFLVSWIHASTDPLHVIKNVELETFFPRFFESPKNNNGPSWNRFAENIWEIDPSKHLLCANSLQPTKTSQIPNSDAPPKAGSAAIGVRQMEKGGISYDQGYSTLEGLFFPIRRLPNIWPFIDLRGHRFDNNDYAANGGVGVRYYSEKKKAILGLNAYCDYRADYGNRLHFTQFGVGAEILAHSLDFRINGYIPTTKSQVIQTCVFDNYVGGYYMIEKKREKSLLGADAEIGGFLFYRRYLELYSAGGGYYYEDICQKFIGGRFRINLRIFRTLTCDYIMTYDPVYRTKIQGQVGLSYRFGVPEKKWRTSQRLTEPVIRNEIIVLSKYCDWKTNF